MLRNKTICFKFEGIALIRRRRITNDCSSTGFRHHKAYVKQTYQPIFRPVHILCMSLCTALCTVHYTLYTIHCTLYTVHYTLTRLLMIPTEEEEDTEVTRLMTSRQTVIEVKVPLSVAGAIIGPQGSRIRQVGQSGHH